MEPEADTRSLAALQAVISRNENRGDSLPAVALKVRADGFDAAVYTAPFFWKVYVSINARYVLIFIMGITVHEL